MNYGGMALCPTCYDIHNPQLRTVYLIPKEQKERMVDRRWKLEKELRELVNDLDIDDKLIKSGQKSITFKTLRRQ